MPSLVEEVIPSGGVVVGDDGSHGAKTALHFAMDEARRRHSALHIIRAWSIKSAVRPSDAIRGYVPSLREYEAATRNAIGERVVELFGEVHDVEVQLHAVHGSGPKALIQASRTADVVVVGARGVGGFAGLILGSVAEQCIRHCEGPVIVVRPRSSPS